MSPNNGEGEDTYQEEDPEDIEKTEEAEAEEEGESGEEQAPDTKEQKKKIDQVAFIVNENRDKVDDALKTILALKE